MPLVPASLDFTPDGTPYSVAYEDVYHSSAGAVEQAEQVFLAGNDLPVRWRQRRHFVVGETGFGLGLNFLVTWAAWRADPQRSERLHFISCELHPFSREDLAVLHQRWPALAPLADALQQEWPPLVPGMHRLNLDEGRVTLTLFFGDAVQALDSFRARVDAFYLDGFSPARNPELWAARIFYRLGRLAAPGATLATWSVAGEVRENLRRAGFVVEKVPGFATKRHMLRGHYAGRVSAVSTALGEAQAAMAGRRHALVIGAGIAGTSIAERLAARGWQVDVVEAGAGPGAGASGNHAGVLRPLPSMGDEPMSRLTRAGVLYGLNHLRRVEKAGVGLRWSASGVLHLGRDDEQEQVMARVVAHHQPPESYLRYVEAAEASALTGWPVTQGGWWFPSSGWIQPPSLCRANLALHPDRIRTVFGQSVASFAQREDGWAAYGEDGQLIASAPVLILANGVAVRSFPQAAALHVVSARGQVSLLPAGEGSPPKVVVCRLGYVSPAVDGWRCAGATFSVDDEESALREVDHAENLAKLEGILPGFTADISMEVLKGRVGYRPASPDRMPMVGAMPQMVPRTALVENATLEDVPRYAGLYAVSGFGARGLVWAALMGEALAAELEGEPLPLESGLWRAVDPARYVLKPRA